jgi:hypothetical protein
MNVFLMGVPLWITAIVLPLSILGLIDAPRETAQRVGFTFGLYLLAFSIVGAPFNYYWGFLTAPLLAIGLAGAPRALRRAYLAANIRSWIESAMSGHRRVSTTA